VVRVVPPDRGDVVWLVFDPQAGHEQAGRRLALTVSPRTYNAKVGLALFCPITTRVKGYPFEVAFPRGSKTTGVVLSDREAGDHLAGDMIEWWTTTLPVAAEIETAPIEIDSSDRSQIVGTFTYRFADATQVDCDFDLRRDRSRDVD
jgi:hypothetical protein